MLKGHIPTAGRISQKHHSAWKFILIRAFLLKKSFRKLWYLSDKPIQTEGHSLLGLRCFRNVQRCNNMTKQIIYITFRKAVAPYFDKCIWLLYIYLRGFCHYSLCVGKYLQGNVWELLEMPELVGLQLLPVFLTSKD